VTLLELIVVLALLGLVLAGRRSSVHRPGDGFDVRPRLVARDRASGGRPAR
jgi:hypothetical protein